MPEDPLQSPPTAPGPADDAYARVIDRLADLLATASAWLRQEAETTVREKIVPPLQKLGITVASASAAAALLVVGLLFISTFAIMLLGDWLGYPWAFLIVGVMLLGGSGAFLAVKVRSMQR